MPELRLIPLQDTMTAEELALLTHKLEELASEALPDEDDSHDLDDVLSDDQLIDFVDRLEAHDIACDVYLPMEFEGRLELGDHSIGSAHMLMEALEELRDELDIDEDADDDSDDDDVDLEVIEDQLSYAWHVFARGASACITRQIPLHVLP
ncbi:MAG: hypothetical protein JRH20_03050 [Deltaproteobacteria bacterium]|nr:hypothetical protein [Deltaproteobacteria bacterium]